ncbi:MAG: M4 family metallopeptidase [Patescibacteria group bacterium]
MLTVFFVVNYLVFGLSCPAQAIDNINIFNKERLNNPNNGNSLSNQVDPVAISKQLLKQTAEHTGIQSDIDTTLEPITHERDRFGINHIGYEQTYRGLPVYGAHMLVHYKNINSKATVNGRVISDIAINSIPSLTQQEASSRAAGYWQSQFNTIHPVVVSAQLVVFNKGFILNYDDNDNRLAWVIELNQLKPKQHETFFIDAQNGSLLYQVTHQQTAVSRRIYDCTWGWPCLLDTTIYGYTYGRSEGTTVRGTNPVYGNEDLDNLYDLVNGVHNYYAATFGRDGGNNLGGIGDGLYAPETSTDGFVYLDGVTPGDCPNAYFDGYSINFCAGLVTTDSVGHEYTHAVSMYSVPGGGLIYSGESGALSEAYSDIFADAFENYYEGSGDWQIGEDITATGMSAPLRSLSNPAGMTDDTFAIPYPDRFFSENYFCGSGDGGGVHHNGTVPGYAAYLMVQGGTFNGCSITGLGRAKQEQIFYRALTTYLTASSTFNQTYSALLAACADLYSSVDCKQVKKALKAVEMDQAGYCSGETRVQPNCAELDNMAYVSSITSNKLAGSYKVGEVVDIHVNFSKLVTATGVVTVTLNNNKTCAFNISSANNGSCDYIVQAGDDVTALDVASITGTVVDEDNYNITDFTPVANLSDMVVIIIDTTTPTITGVEFTADTKVVGKKQSVTVGLLFSELVTTTTDITVLLETGIIDQSCTITVSQAETGTCAYVVQTGDLTQVLAVQQITGSIVDAAYNSTTEFGLPANLSEDTSLIIDGISPKGSIVLNHGQGLTNSIFVDILLSAKDTGSKVKKMRFSNNGKKWSAWEKYKKVKQAWSLTETRYGGNSKTGKKRVYVQFKDKGNNRSKKKSDMIYLF